jgi:hypothetical protein
MLLYRIHAYDDEHHATLIIDSDRRAPRASSRSRWTSGTTRRITSGAGRR